MSPLLCTRRLELVPATLEHIQSELRNPGNLGTLLGVNVPNSWPPGEYNRDAIEYFQFKYQAEGPAAVGWYVWYAITRDVSGLRGDLVAAAGYFGPPAAGTVEIGYSVIPAMQGRGIATEIVAALVEHAFSFGVVNEVIAHTHDHNPASIKVLQKCGFQRGETGGEAGTVEYHRYRSQKA
jgi:[ribosomal protein S5]-alanine N-acetyltransferase